MKQKEIKLRLFNKSYSLTILFCATLLILGGFFVAAKVRADDTCTSVYEDPTVRNYCVYSYSACSGYCVFDSYECGFVNSHCVVDYPYPYPTPYPYPYQYEYQYPTPYTYPYQYQYEYQYPTPSGPYSYEYEYQYPYPYQYEYQTPATYSYQTPAGYSYQSPYGTPYSSPYGYEYEYPTPTYQVTVNKKSGGAETSTDGLINCGSTCSASYNQNSTVTIQAKPSSGYWKFTGWSGDCSGAGDCVLNVNTAKTVTPSYILRIFDYKEF